MAEYTAQVWAHRGGRKWAPENTMIAFKKSLEANVYGIELDVHRCKSGELVVIHDDDLARTTNGVGLVKDCTLEELQRLSAGAWYDAEFTREKIPTLQEVLSLVDGQAVINVEVKNLPLDYPEIEDDVITVLSEYPHKEKIVLSSFDHRVMKVIGERQPEWNIACLMVGVPYDLVGYCRSIKADFFHPEHDSFTEANVAQAKVAGIKINPWTINNERGWANMLKLGVDGIITDDPVGLVNFLAEVAKVST
jgi:Glycerophosphoryl diester phosphodiesterase